MTHMPLAAAFVAAALLVAGSAAAQERPAISLTPAESRAVGHRRQRRVARPADTSGRRRNRRRLVRHVPSGGVSAGRYLTPHLKTEIHAAMTGEGRVYRASNCRCQGRLPVFRAQRALLPNRVGRRRRLLSVLREPVVSPVRRRRTRGPARTAIASRCSTAMVRCRVACYRLPRLAPQVSYAARPFVATGFKWYVAERAFVRTGIQASFSNRGTTHVVWTAGIGADL